MRTVPRIYVAVALSPSPAVPIEFPASEHGGGPRVYPKCHGSHEYRPISSGLALPPLVVAVA